MDDLEDMKPGIRQSLSEALSHAYDRLREDAGRAIDVDLTQADDAREVLFRDDEAQQVIDRAVAELVALIVRDVQCAVERKAAKSV